MSTTPVPPEPFSAEHPSTEHPSTEHPSAEHPSTEHPVPGRLPAEHLASELSTAPGSTAGVLKEFGSYAQAQALVDGLSDAGFPVEHVRIVGEGVRIVEQVTGRMTKGKAALLGAGSGAWFGLFVGFLFGLFTIGSAWLYALAIGLVIGAIWGAIFGFAAHWATRGRRDFSSIRGLEADHYAVLVETDHFRDAVRLAKL